MKVKITGCVYRKNSEKKDEQIHGIVDLPEEEAMRLVELKVAEGITHQDEIDLTLPPENDFINIDTFQKQNQELKTENERLLKDIESYKTQIAGFTFANEELKESQEELQKENESLKTKLAKVAETSKKDK